MVAVVIDGSGPMVGEDDIPDSAPNGRHTHER